MAQPIQPLQSLRNWSFLGSEDYQDPVFEGIVRDFYKFDKSLASIFYGIDRYMLGAQQMSEGLVMLSDEMVQTFVKGTDRVLTTDVIRYRESSHKMGRLDAPISVISKLQRDLEINVVIPIHSHLANNKDIKRNILLRRKRLNHVQQCQAKLNQLLGVENNNGLKIDEGTEAASRLNDIPRNLPLKIRREIDYAEQALDTARLQFKEVDRPLFEWMMMLEAYRCDLYDSLLQTIKQLQYEYFQTCSQTLELVLPPSTQFRPLVEMTPEELKPQVDLELAEYSENDPIILDVTANLLRKWDRDISLHQFEDNTFVPDQLSLSSLTSQGFDEELAKKALRLHHNHTQEALEVLLNNPDVLEVMEANESKVRHPTSLKWAKKLTAFRQERSKTGSYKSKPRNEQPDYISNIPMNTKYAKDSPSNTNNNISPKENPKEEKPEFDLFDWGDLPAPEEVKKNEKPVSDFQLDDIFSMDNFKFSNPSPSLDLTALNSFPNSLTITHTSTQTAPSTPQSNGNMLGTYKSNMSSIPGKGIGNLSLPGENLLANIDEEFEMFASKEQNPIPDIYQLNFQQQTNRITSNSKTKNNKDMEDYEKSSFNSEMIDVQNVLNHF